jgi:hypothetical protein
MTDKQFFSFLGGMFITIGIYALIVFMIFFSTFSFSGQSLSEQETMDAFCFYLALVIVGSTIFIMIRRFRRHEKYTAYGMSLAILAGLVALIMQGAIYFNNLNYYQSFDAIAWKKAEFKPIKMAKTLVKKNALIGLNRQELIEKLGLGNRGGRDGKGNYFAYATDNDWELNVVLENEKVTKAYLYQGGFDG